jgi:hypothetical protein
MSLPVLISVLSIAIEAALVGIIAVQLRNTMHRATLVASLFAEEQRPGQFS